MKVSSGSFRESAMEVAVDAFTEAFEEHHLFTLVGFCALLPILE